MNCRMHMEFEGDFAMLLAFCVRIAPIIEELDIEVDGVHHTQTCEDCGERLSPHKGWLTCMTRTCSMYGAPVSHHDDVFDESEDRAQQDRSTTTTAARR